jgi:hypothetical protein
MKKTLITLSLLGICLTNCTKTTTPVAKVYSEENPLAGFLQKSGADQKVSTFVYTGGLYYENGFSFKTLQKGILKSFVVKLPDADANLEVTLWDLATGNAIKSEVMYISTANTEFTKAITPVNLVSGKEYMVTMQASSEFAHYKNDVSDIVYPQTIGNIAVMHNYTAANITTMPDTINNISSKKCYGDISFVFQQTE